MGKKIIIPGADFSTNGIVPEGIEMELENFGIDISDSNTFGANNAAGYNRLRAINNIFIPNGASILIKGLKGLDGTREALRLDFCYYNSETRSHSTVVGSYSNKVAADYYKLNEELRDEIIISNTFGGDYWFGFCFRRTDNASLQYDISLYNPLTYII